MPEPSPAEEFTFCKRDRKTKNNKTTKKPKPTPHPHPHTHKFWFLNVIKILASIWKIWKSTRKEVKITAVTKKKKFYFGELKISVPCI